MSLKDRPPISVANAVDAINAVADHCPGVVVRIFTLDDVIRDLPAYEDSRHLIPELQAWRDLGVHSDSDHRQLDQVRVQVTMAKAAAHEAALAGPTQWAILEKGAPVHSLSRYRSEDVAAIAAHELQERSQHGSHAFEVIEVPANTWTDAEAALLRKKTQRYFSMHDCQGSRLIENRVNCSACCLGGYQPSKLSDSELAEHDVRTDGPNVAAWALDYVAAGRQVPKKWLPAFRRDFVESDNPRYAAVIARTIRYWQSSPELVAMLAEYDAAIIGTDVPA